MTVLISNLTGVVKFINILERDEHVALDQRFGDTICDAFVATKL